MSKFIRSAAALAASRSSGRCSGSGHASRITGFTDAELAAAEWASSLVEVREAMSRPTNSEVRGLGRSDVPAQEKARNKEEMKARKRARKEAKVQVESENQLKKAARKEAKRQAKRAGTTERNAEKKQGNIGRKAETNQRAQTEEVRQTSVATEQSIKETAGAVNEAIRELIATAAREASGACLESALASGSTGVATPMPSGTLASANLDLSRSAPPLSEPGVLGAGVTVSQRSICSSSCSSSSSLRPASPAGLLAPPVVEITAAAVPVPRDPMNPLELAHDLKAYDAAMFEASSRCYRRRHQEGDSSSNTEPEWDHKPFLERSLSPCRERTDGPFTNTRKGAWKSRAGGVYLPPVPRPGSTNDVEGNVTQKVFVRGLPKDTTAESVAKHFEQFGPISNVELKYDGSGDFRGFCFVTFDSVDAARSLLEKKAEVTFEGKRIDCHATGPRPRSPSPSPSPARYLFPEEFKRLAQKKRRRSASSSSCSSSSPSVPAVDPAAPLHEVALSRPPHGGRYRSRRRAGHRRRHRSGSRAAPRRRSPVYALD